jgi:succinoglycan biosynthesis transport protein ExoP
MSPVSHAADRGGSAESGVIAYRRPPQGLQLVSDVVDEGIVATEDRAAQFWSIFQTLMRRRWLILVVLLVGLAVSATVTLLRTPIYRASASLEVQRQESQIIQGGEVQPTTIADAEHMATQYALLKSRALAERVAEVLDLPADERFADPEEFESRADRLRRATEVVTKGLEVAPVARSRVIDIRFKSPYPQESARIVNALADNFIEMNLERRYNATSYARTFLEERLSTTKASLEDAERRLVAYSKEKEILDLSSVGGSEIGSSLDASSLMALNASLTEAQDARILAERQYLEARDNSTTRALLENEVIQELRKARSELSGEYEQKLGKFKPEYPDMKELAARIASIDKDISAERSNIVSSLEAEFRGAVVQEEALKARVEELKDEVQDLRGRSIDYNILSREVDTLRSQYDALLQRFKEVSISGGVGASQVSIVDRAEVPKIPFEPNLQRILLFSTFLSLMLAIGLALLLEYIDDTIKTPDDVKAKLALAVIGIVPRLKGQINVADELRDPKSIISEAFSSARTALQFATPAGAPRTLLVTGIRPSEGKTSSSLSLAVSFANAGKRVLIIDADMRRPSFAAAPGASVGLSGCLTQDAPLEENVVPGPVTNLFLLPAGFIPPNPAELLASPRLAELIAEAKQTFDLVVVDSCPVLDFADAPSLASVCEATLLILQAGAIRRPVARRTIDRLLEAQGVLIGALLTKYDIRRSGYGYGYSYNYAYGYKASAKGVAAEALKRRRITLFATGDKGAEDNRKAS